MLNRILLAVFFLVFPRIAEAITADEVVERVQQHDADARAAQAYAAFVDSQRVSAALYPNPSLAWNRQTFDAEREDQITLNVPLDLSGRRNARERIAHAKGLAAESTAADATRGATVRALRLFYRAVAASERERVQTSAVARLDEAARVVSRRREEGHTAGYDEARVQIEREIAASALRETRARRQQLVRELAILLGLEGVKIDGDLGLDETSPANAEERRSVALLRSAKDRADAAGATWTWIPLLTLFGGPRFGVLDQPGGGYVAGVSVGLPVFSRGQGLDAQAEAAARAMHARAEAAARRARLEEERAALAFATARDESVRFTKATVARVERLERATETGYREGQRTVVELIDARRVRTEVALRALDLALAAKTAHVELRAARGEFE
ncbi:MAG: TolC family protein [Deltaproteobacteria bacterium]|jgi:cobalt-zinc-cadmium efflux system outer membrane protein